MVIVNSITIPIPRPLTSGISPALLSQLVNDGPCTRPFLDVLRVLNLDVVQASSYAMIKETGTWVNQVMVRMGVPDYGSLTIAVVARAACGRPNIQAGKTPMNINPPIMKCDTKSINDGIKILDYMERFSDGQPVKIVQCDGQSMVLCGHPSLAHDPSPYES